MWALIFGNWGDQLIGWATHLKEFGPSPVLLHCDDQDKINFFNTQKDATKVVAIENPNQGYLHAAAVYAIFNISDTQGYCFLAANKYKIDPSEVCFPRAWAGAHPKFDLPMQMQLNTNAVAVAGDIIRDLPRPIVHLHPWSFASCGPERHWVHWHKFVEILQMTGGSFILTGQNDVANFQSRKNFKNLTNQMRSNQAVFSLSDQADLTVCTSNSLASWCALHNRRTLIINNEWASRPDDDFRHLYNCAPNVKHLDWKTPLDVALRIYAEEIKRV